jgi:GTP-binding protein
MAQYLELRRNLHGVVLMVDARLGLTELDRRLLEFIAPRIANGEVRLLVLLTKADKLSRREAGSVLASTQAVLAELSTEAADIGVALFSALKRQGIDDAALALREWLSRG